ncbi:MAG TPA: GSCFA domain-containing protein [Ferruginibacter sp.]|nr:GSCFA domain-containing protein [Ferruginibacter sp.]
MDFHAEFFPKPFISKINHQHKLLLAGSCFTEQIGAKLSKHKFNVLDNPNGILFNPVSIADSVRSYIHHKTYKPEDLFWYNELWGSWDHHTRFSNIDREVVLEGINDSQAKAHGFLKSADWILLTLGSAFVYEMEGGRVVANCHKVPTDKFTKKLLSVEEVVKVLGDSLKELFEFNPGIKVIFTISPVRHLRDGFIENNFSKATLIHAVHQLIEKYNAAQYFPAYELIIDDLRDYRFFAEDMVHPNYAATNYVWEKFIQAAIDESSQKLMKEIAVINAARDHKAFNPTSQQHKKFLQAHLEKVKKLQMEHDYLDLDEEARYFGGVDISRVDIS